jgi:Glycosyl transferase family 2
VEIGGEIQYGRSLDVPSRLDESAEGLATVVFIAGRNARANVDALGALERSIPADVHVVVVADGVDAPSTGQERIRTSSRVGAGAALNIGIRRAQGQVIVVLDPSIVATGDMVTPLAKALSDPGVAVAGASGVASSDMNRFEDVAPTDGGLDVVAIRGPLLAFRREDAVASGAVDEAFRIDRYLDIWWSLVLRDRGEGEPPRRALAIGGLPFERHEAAGSKSSSRVDDRQAKRNFYRVLDRFRTRLDLVVPAKALSK